MATVLQTLTRPFLYSLARGFDLLGAYNRRSAYETVAPAEADRRAFVSDWEAIGADLRVAVHEMGEEAVGSRAYA